jgi:hypothetical protein
MSSGHRPQRETSSSNKELAEVKRENHKLKRQIARLQKYVTKLMEQGPASVVPDEGPVQPLENSIDCQTCGKPLTIVSFGTKVLKACKACGWRQVVPK